MRLGPIGQVKYFLINEVFKKKCEKILKSIFLKISQTWQKTFPVIFHQFLRAFKKNIKNFFFWKFWSDLDIHQIFKISKTLTPNWPPTFFQIFFIDLTYLVGHFILFELWPRWILFLKYFWLEITFTKTTLYLSM